MQTEIVSRATAAVTSLAGALDLRVDDAVVVRNSNKLTLRLLPCDVLARIALAGEEVAALEVDISRRLAAVKCPVAVLDPRVEPRVYQCDGFAVTFWAYYETATTDLDLPAEYSDALYRLHTGMRSMEILAPHFTERAAEAERLVTSREATPGLSEVDRHLLVSSLHSARQRIRARGRAEQLLHGEPHPGNVLRSQNGILFIDFETCCRGPIEFDLAHVPDEVSGTYPNVDQVLLGECRRLVLATVAAWRWDARDEFPNGLRHGRDVLTMLRKGAPWPALGDLAGE